VSVDRTRDLQMLTTKWKMLTTKWKHIVRGSAFHTSVENGNLNAEIMRSWTHMLLRPNVF